MNSNTHPPGVACLRAQALHALAVDDWAGKLAAVRAIDDAPIVDTERRLEPTRALPGRPARPGWCRRSSCGIARRPRPKGAPRAARAGAYRIQRGQPGAGHHLAFRRHADGVLPGLAARGARRGHFELLNQRLASLGHVYGDFPAHNGLWDMAERTRGDLLARLALVPRTLEARGLDASPMIRDKLNSVGDAESAAVLDIILADEIGHVAIGNRWFKHLCAQQGRDPVACYAELAQLHGAPRLRGPFNLEARRAAGFDETELAALQAASPTL